MPLALWARLDWLERLILVMAIVGLTLAALGVLPEPAVRDWVIIVCAVSAVLIRALGRER